MKNNQIFFKKNLSLPVDTFFENVLFDKKYGYYSSKNPFGRKGDFLTAPGISNLFSEMIGIWLVSIWDSLGKPKKFNIVELGPGEGDLTKILIKTFKRFPEFYKSTKIYLYEKSYKLIKLQKKKINDPKVTWVNNFSKIKDGPVIFFGNEFFDAIPIKQFSRKGKLMFEKHYLLDKNKKICEIYKKASNEDINLIKKFSCLKNIKFIEFPKLGLNELDKIIRKISVLNGGLLLIDYGYLISNNKSTLQSVFKHKRNDILQNLGKADVTSLVNFNLLKEYVTKKKLLVKKIVEQKSFLKQMGIIERANNISKKMGFMDQTNLYLRLKRLLDTKSMGSLFKVMFAYKLKKHNFFGFD